MPPLPLGHDAAYLARWARRHDPELRAYEYLHGLASGRPPVTAMDATREAHLGVGSAIHDVTRQLAGALGVAVVGSALAALYARRIDAATAALPEASRAGARDSLGGALDLAAWLPAEAGVALAGAARVAFAEAFGLAVLVGVGVALAGALAVARLLPPCDDEVTGNERHTHAGIDGAAAAQAAAPGAGWLRDLGRQAGAVGVPGEAHEEAPGPVGGAVSHPPR